MYHCTSQNTQGGDLSLLVSASLSLSSPPFLFTPSLPSAARWYDEYADVRPEFLHRPNELPPARIFQSNLSPSLASAALFCSFKRSFTELSWWSEMGWQASLASQVMIHEFLSLSYQCPLYQSLSYQCRQGVLYVMMRCYRQTDGRTFRAAYAANNIQQYFFISMTEMWKSSYITFKRAPSGHLTSIFSLKKHCFPNFILKSWSYCPWWSPPPAKPLSYI